MIVDDVKGHILNDVKECARIFKSRNEDEEDENVHNLIEQLTMADGIMLVALLIDVTLGKN